MPRTFKNQNRHAVRDHSELPGIGSGDPYCRFTFAVCLLSMLWLCIAIIPAAAQDAEMGTPTRVALFLDCDYCDETFIRQEMPYVDHVRDREVANVHVIVTREETGSGGEARTLDVIGLGIFDGLEFSTVFNAPANASDAEERDGFLRTLEAALVPYLMQTPVREQLRVDILPFEASDAEVLQTTEDPWNNWTIEIYGDGSADFESRQRSFDTRYGVFVSRVTEEWKLQLRPFFNYNYDRFERDEGTITSSARRDGVTSYAVRSISPHWSVGAYGDILTSTFSNVDWRYRFMGALEWSLNPYRGCTHACAYCYARPTHEYLGFGAGRDFERQLTVAYRAGGSHITYQDTTIYNEIEQLLPQHLLNAEYEVVQPWGGAEIGINASQYLHDLSFYSLQFNAEFEVRVTRGLSVEIGGFLELIHDQINLPKGSADLEEVLLRRRQLATNYEAGISFGLRYRFGSLLNNVVNTRFDGIGNRDSF